MPPVQKVDGSSPPRCPECSLTAHLAANGYMVATLAKYRRRGKELATLPHMLLAQDKSLTGTPLGTKVYGTTFTYFTQTSAEQLELRLFTISVIENFPIALIGNTFLALVPRPRHFPWHLKL